MNQTSFKTNIEHLQSMTRALLDLIYNLKRMNFPPSNHKKGTTGVAADRGLPRNGNKRVETEA